MPESCSTLSLPPRPAAPEALSCAGCDGRLQLRPSLGVLLEENPQNALLRGADELQVHHVQPMRGGHPCRRRSDFVQLDCHRSYTPASKNRSPGTPFYTANDGFSDASTPRNLPQIKSGL